MTDTALPSGTVTFLFTDIEGSTRLSQEYAADMPRLLARHHAILREAIITRQGYIFNIVGDSFAVAFHSAGDALDAALNIQTALLTEDWSPAPVKVRIGIHSGAARLVDPTGSQPYDGYTAIATAQRIMSAGHGGQILLSQTAADLARGNVSPEVELIDKGERVLRDIVQPVHIYQVSAPQLPSNFAPLKTDEVVRHNLPAQTTPFVGRVKELADLTALVTDGKNRLITLVAPGGMGKTRIVQQAAENMVDAFPQGVYFVALDRLTSANQVVGAVADALPITLSSNDSPERRILDYLSDLRILLVMDNFEHVLGGTDFVQEILRAAPNVQILATSRERLRLSAETVMTIEGLKVTEGDTGDNSAIQLFAQSARQVRLDFELDATTLPAVRRICILVDGMPLAILLAAAWVDTLSVHEIEGEIIRSLDLLETELSDIPERQRSVRVVIESSWNQVDTNAQELLKRLSVFRGGFTREAAQEAAGASLRGLSQLVDKSLLLRDPIRNRYSIHEMLRQYAEQQLGQSADEEHAAHESHAQYFAQYMARQWTLLRGNRLASSLLEVEAEMDNVRVTRDFWLKKQDASHLLQLVGALWYYFEVTGSITPAIQMFGETAQQLRSDQPDIAIARAQLRACQSWFMALIGLPEEGMRLVRESINVLQQHSQGIDFLTQVAIPINALWLNRRDELRLAAQDLLTWVEEKSSPEWERGWALIWWAYSLLIDQKFGEAVVVSEEVLGIARTLGNQHLLAWAEVIRGGFQMSLGDYRAAKPYFLRGAEQADAINYRRMRQVCYETLGTIALMENDIDQAEQYSLACLRITHENGQTREMLAALRDLAQVHMAHGEMDQALQLLAVILHHPAAQQNTINRPEPLRDEAERLRAEVATQLEPPRYQAAWDAGQQRRLADVVSEFLN